MNNILKCKGKVRQNKQSKQTNSKQNEKNKS